MSIITVVLALVVLGSTTGIANASLQVSHKSFTQMTHRQIIVVLKKQIYKDKSVLRFWHNHRYLANKSSRIAQQFRRQTHWAKVSLKIATKNLHKLLIVSVARVVVSGSDISTWMCIHRYEGSWTDSGSPYWGGLQMDSTFQKEYGPEFVKRYGTADHWPVIDQIIAARRARDGWRNPFTGQRFSARGYSPWPVSSGYCGV